MALAALAALLVLAGCGFRPLYGDHGGIEMTADLSFIEVNTIPERIGLQVYNRLLDNISPDGKPERPRYRLTVALDTANNALVTEKDSQIRRFDLIVAADFLLLDYVGGETLYRGAARAAVSYNVVERATFATRVAEEDAERQAAVVVGDDIATQIALFFQRARGG